MVLVDSLVSDPNGVSLKLLKHSSEAVGVRRELRAKGHVRALSLIDPNLKSNVKLNSVRIFSMQTKPDIRFRFYSLRATAFWFCPTVSQFSFGTYTSVVSEFCRYRVLECCKRSAPESSQGPSPWPESSAGDRSNEQTSCPTNGSNAYSEPESISRRLSSLGIDHTLLR